MNLEGDFQEWDIFSFLVPPNNVNFSHLHTLGGKDFDISFDLQSTTIYDDVDEEGTNFIGNGELRGDIVDL